MRKKIFVILLLFIFGLFFYQIKKVRPLLWDGNSRISLVFALEPVVVASLEPGKDLTVFRLPENLYLRVPHGFGQYQLGSVYELGELEEGGGELLRETVQEYLGVPVDGYIKIPNTKYQIKNKKTVLNCLILLLPSRGETNLSKWDLLRLWWEIRKLRSDKVKFFDLGETNILTEKSLPDGSLIFETELFRLDELVRNHCIDHKIYEERLAIEVLNATDHSGLANRVARLMTNIGGDIVAVGNSNDKYQISNIKYQKKDLRKSYTVRKLEKILGVKAEVGEMGESRADLLILVGEDYWKMVE